MGTVIPRLPQAYLEHLVAPRHMGDVPEAHAAGEVGSMVGGLGVRVTLAFRDAGQRRAVIARAGARVFGSAAPVAPASKLLDMAIGLTPEDAAAISVPCVQAALGNGTPLPARVAKGTEFVVEALRRALGMSEGAPSDPRGAGILVCRCLGVGDRVIRAAVAGGARTPEEIGEQCGATLGCRSCRPDVRVLLDQEIHPPEATPPTDLPPIERIVRAHVLPLLRAHGVAIAASRATDAGVRLVLRPLWQRPEISPQGAHEMARWVLRETVHDEVRVEVEGWPAPAA
jgi:bacterioferritin-associated ferredoxin